MNWYTDGKQNVFLCWPQWNLFYVLTVHKPSALWTSHSSTDLCLSFFSRPQRKRSDVSLHLCSGSHQSYVIAKKVSLSASCLFTTDKKKKVAPRTCLELNLVHVQYIYTDTQHKRHCLFGIIFFLTLIFIVLYLKYSNVVVMTCLLLWASFDKKNCLSKICVLLVVKSLLGV